MYQMTIFDLIPSENRFPTLIKELAKDVKQILGTPDEENYNVWSHVPNLGKRYEAWYNNILFTEEKNNEFVKIQNKFKNTFLEISIDSVPSLDEKGTTDVMVSTMWNTKGHKEVL